MSPTSNSLSPLSPDGFVVCGLGSLGQHCIANLKSFGVPVHAVNLTQPNQWEMTHLQNLIDRLVVGDCRQPDILEQAGIRSCRAILLVTQDERVNLEAALTARVLNPRVRLVMRSDQQNLNDLIGQQLLNFVAFEPTQLAAPAFALEALSDRLVGYFTIEGHRFQVVKQRLDVGHPWCDRRQLHELDTLHQRVLRHHSASSPAPNPTVSPSSQFYAWLPDTSLREGDEIVTIESDIPLNPDVLSKATRNHASLGKRLGQIINALQDIPELQRKLIGLWQASYGQHIRRVAILCGITVVGLCLVGTLLLDANAPEDISRWQAFILTFVTLFGGFGDVFEPLDDFSNSEWLQFFGVVLTMAGAAFIGVLYALLTEKLLSLRFEFTERRPPVPDNGHVVVVWLGRIGRQVLKRLQDLDQPVVGLSPVPLDGDVLPKVPLLVGDVSISLEKANLATAKSLVAVSDDEIQNLEVGLLAHRVNPRCRAIIRTYDQRFTDRVSQIFPFTQVICVSAIAAEAFAGAAFGEQVIGLFRLDQHTIMVTQYTIETDDTLNGLLLSEVAYGYGVLPIWYQHALQPGKVMPSEDIRLQPDDCLVVLATISGLRRIEQGQLAVKTWQVRVDKAMTTDALFDGASEIARVSGYRLRNAREFMTRLPNTIPCLMYHHQALRLARLLNRAQVKAWTIPPGESKPTN